MKQRLINQALLGLLCVSLTSCSIIRGLRMDGKGGPGIFSFTKHPHDTIANGDNVFSFPVAHHQASWIDTLHFFNQGKYYKNATLPEAISKKSSTQGVMIIHNDSIIYEKYWEKIEENVKVPDYPVTLFYTREGYFKKITPQSLRMSGEQKLKAGDKIVQTVEAANDYDLLFFSDI